MIRQQEDNHFDTFNEVIVGNLAAECGIIGDFTVCSDAGFFIMEASTLNFLWVNDKYIEITGFDSQTIFTPNFFDLIISSIQSFDIEEMDDFFDFVRGKKGVSFSKIYKQRHGRVKGKWLNLYVNIVVDSLDADGRPNQLQGFVVDLTGFYDGKSHNECIQSTCSNSSLEGEEELLNSLTKREKEILKLIVQGYNHREIADQLNISRHTADTHRKNIIQKVKVKNTANLAFFVGKIGLF